VLSARRQGLRAQRRPWLMVSLNDGEDPHFRKAAFDPTACPIDCPRPCETICPAQAIVFDRARAVAQSHPSLLPAKHSLPFSGVIDSRCYGCGRCVPICPIQHISTHSYVSTPATIAPLVLSGVDAVEIHTQVGRLTDFERLWQAIMPFVDRLKLVAISCPDGEDLIDYLWALHNLVSPLPCPLVWQTDGRPMSGDIGDGATRATVRLGQKVLAARLPGYVQLAGGTNNHTVEKLRRLGLLAPIHEDCNCDAAAGAIDTALESSNYPGYIAGVAYGSYARVLLSDVFNQLEQLSTDTSTTLRVRTFDWQEHLADSEAQRRLHLEANPGLLWQAVHLANTLVSQLKSSMPLLPEFNPVEHLL